MNVEYMTTAEVADLCRTSPETVRWWRYVGKGPASFRLGRRVLYPAPEVRRWLEDQADAASGGEAAPVGTVSSATGQPEDLQPP